MQLRELIFKLCKISHCQFTRWNLVMVIVSRFLTGLHQSFSFSPCGKPTTATREPGFLIGDCCLTRGCKIKIEKKQLVHTHKHALQNLQIYHSITASASLSAFESKSYIFKARSRF